MRGNDAVSLFRNINCGRRRVALLGQRRWAGAAISIALVMAALECNRETLSLQSTSDIVAFSS
jgi:hypothetical protein